MYYTTKTRANYNDCDLGNRLKLSAAMKCMQQTSSEHLEHLGFSPERLYGEGMVFLLTKSCLKIHRMPRCSETMVVGTAPLHPKGPRFYREFIVESEAGERLISAMTLWILVDPVSRKILRPAAFPYPITFQEPGLEGVIGDVPLPKGLEPGAVAISVPVRYSHIDVNGHMNNTFYGDLSLDALPVELLTERELDTVVISFQNEARLGDLLEISTLALEDGGYYLRGTHGGAACFESLVRFR